MKFVHILSRIVAFFTRRLSRASTFLFYFETGMKYDYPLCCIAHFAWNAADPKFRRAKRAMGRERGGIHVSEDKVYVPCWFHLHICRPENWRAHNEAPSWVPLHPKLFYMEPELHTPKSVRQISKLKLKIFG